MNWLRNIMVGRYGRDQLSIYLLVLAIILTLVGRFAGISALIFISYIPLLLTLFRMFSKDVKKRSMENYKFAIAISSIYARINNLTNRIKGSKTHKYYKCSNCSTTLRVPKGKGKVLVTCPKCKLKFTKKT